MVDVVQAHLIAMVPKIRPDRALSYADAINDVLADAEIDTAQRLVHFMAQIAHESAGFSALVESTNYKNAAYLDKTFSNVKGLAQAQALIAKGPVAIGNCIYANRLGNGNEASGDGYRYRGRGFMMITGKNNYREVEAYSGLPVIAHPELLGQAGPAAQAAARFWLTRNINTAADADDIAEVTRLINGPARHGLDQRQTWLNKTKAIWL
ncbi:hypothetical protein Q1W73_06535 [Asticcacaulis sp. ZE23SCel15]|uniref:glycoside hydrolase family 19 protein n=1 Tax=Asticcacaulis sp. ZE23SCel15 TaxID=3059027 RepID=UPI00265E00CB|nr:hypothetical protein [Asticcacaulis sp. ZE23SCel15]WKL58638.1 hypothetical protein Q1W73_06535 [Asticcacaulis sp. ZE23SCel15]